MPRYKLLSAVLILLLLTTGLGAADHAKNPEPDYDVEGSLE